MKPEKRRQRAKKKAKQHNIMKIAKDRARRVLGQLPKGMSTERKVRGIRNLMDAGMVSGGKVRMDIIKASEKNMRKKVRSGKETTVEALTKSLDDEPEFMKLCEEVGLDRAFFEGMAETIIKENQ